MIESIVVELLRVCLESGKACLHLLSSYGSLMLMSSTGSLVAGSLVAATVKAGVLVPGCSIAIVIAGSTPCTRGALVSSTVTTIVIASLKPKFLHEEAILPGVIGRATRFAMFWAWPFKGLLITVWTEVLPWLPIVATLLLPLGAGIRVGDQVGSILVKPTLVLISIAIALLILISATLLSLAAVLLSLAGFVLVGLAILGFIRLGVLGDCIHEFSHISDCSFDTAEFVD